MLVAYAIIANYIICKLALGISLLLLYLLFIPTEYHETVKLTMARKSRALVRVIERKTAKFEIFYKR